MPELVLLVVVLCFRFVLLMTSPPPNLELLTNPMWQWPHHSEVGQMPVSGFMCLPGFRGSGGISDGFTRGRLSPGG